MSRIKKQLRNHYFEQMKVFKFFPYIFSFAGVAVLALGIFLTIKNIVFLSNATTTEGTIVGFSKTKINSKTIYSPVIRFTSMTGNQIECASSTSSSIPSYNVGEKIEILYNVKSPHEVKVNDFSSKWGAISILILIGTVFSILGIKNIISEKKKIKELNHLKKFGKEINTDFQQVIYNTSRSINGKHPYQIVSQWLETSTNKIHEFTSDYIWYDPTLYIKSDKIKVIVNSQDFNKYFVDISFLPKHY